MTLHEAIVEQLRLFYVRMEAAVDIKFSEQGRYYADETANYITNEILSRSDTAPKTCTWTADEDAIYRTSCGHHFVYTDGTRTECSAKFCQACGGTIKGDE